MHAGLIISLSSSEAAGKLNLLMITNCSRVRPFKSRETLKTKSAHCGGESKTANGANIGLFYGNTDIHTCYSSYTITYIAIRNDLQYS